MDESFGIATSALTSQKLSNLSACSCIWSKDYCYKTVKTRSLLRKRNIRNCTNNTLLFSSLFKICVLFFNGRITFLSVRNLPAIRYLIIRYLSLNKLIMPPFTISAEESALDCSSDTMKFIMEMAVSFYWTNKGILKDSDFDIFGIFGYLNYDRLILSLSVKIDMSDLTATISCFSTSLLFCRAISILILNRNTGFQLYCLEAQNHFISEKKNVVFSYFNFFAYYVQCKTISSLYKLRNNILFILSKRLYHFTK